MKIAYVSHEDAANPSIQSGRTAALLEEFLRLGHEVERIFPLNISPSGAEFAKKVGYRILGKHHRNDRNAEFLEALGAEFAARTAGRTFDLVFCPGTEAFADKEKPRRYLRHSRCKAAPLVKGGTVGAGGSWILQGHLQLLHPGLRR